MSETARPDEIIRGALIDNLLTDYNPAIFWADDEQPFSDKTSSVLMVKYEGREREGVYNVGDCQVWLFSPVNSTMAQCDALRDDAISARKWLYDNHYLPDDIMLTHHIEDVSSPLRTNDNRFICRFTVRALSGDPEL